MPSVAPDVGDNARCAIREHPQAGDKSDAEEDARAIDPRGLHAADCGLRRERERRPRPRERLPEPRKHHKVSMNPNPIQPACAAWIARQYTPALSCSVGVGRRAFALRRGTRGLTTGRFAKRDVVRYLLRDCPRTDRYDLPKPYTDVAQPRRCE
jgi:hypothetical protein